MTSGNLYLPHVFLSSLFDAVTMFPCLEQTALWVLLKFEHLKFNYIEDLETYAAVILWSVYI